MRPGHDSGQGRLAALGRLGRRHQDNGSGAVVDAGRIRGRNGSFLVESRPQLRDALKRHAMFGVFIGIDDDIALAALDRHGRNFILEATCLLRRFGLVLRSNCKFVLLGARRRWWELVALATPIALVTLVGAGAGYVLLLLASVAGTEPGWSVTERAGGFPGAEG